MLTSSVGVERNHGKSEQYVEKNHLREPSWKHYARGMLFLSPKEKKCKSKMCPTFSPQETDKSHESQIFSKRCVAQFGQDDSNRTDVLVSITEHYENRHCLNKQNSKNGMLKRLSNCFTWKQRVAESRIRTKRNVVLGFYPRLYTIHENSSESVPADLDTIPTHKCRSSEAKKRDVTAFCRTSDPKLAALQKDIKALWKRLENVEKEFAWARASLEMCSSDVNH